MTFKIHEDRTFYYSEKEKLSTRWPLIMINHSFDHFLNRISNHG